jgi:hypothetical protein
MFSINKGIRDSSHLLLGHMLIQNTVWYPWKNISMGNAFTFLHAAHHVALQCVNPGICTAICTWEEYLNCCKQSVLQE